VFNFKQVGNSFVYIVSDLLVKALPFFLIPIITRYLSVEEYGEVALAQTLIEVCTIALIFGSHHYYRYEFFKGNLNKEHLFFVPIRVAFFNFIFIFLFTLLLFFISGSSKFWYLLLPFAALFQTVISLFICKFQTIEKPIAVGLTNFSQAFIAFIFTVLLLSIGLGIDGRVFAIIFTPVLIGSLALGYTLYQSDLKQFRASFPLFKRGMKFGAKAFPSSISWWLRSGMDRVLLQYMVGVAAVGVFSIAVQFSLVITVIAGAINNAIMPSIFKNVNDKKYILVFKMIVSAVAIVTLFACCLILVSPILIDVILPNEYQMVGDFFTPLIIASILHASFLFLSNILVAENMVAKLSAISIFSAIFHLIISVFMINLFGLKGLVWSGVISYGFSAILLMSVCIRSQFTK